MISLEEVKNLRFFSDCENCSDGSDDFSCQNVVNFDPVVDADHRKFEGKNELTFSRKLKKKEIIFL